jgi:dTDP-glucose pyrophosphorylase
MSKWQDVLSPSTATLAQIIARIDASAHQIALVVDSDGRLIGVMTDGDIRRAILRGLPMTTSVLEVMNNKPLSAKEGTPSRELLALMRRHVVHQIPIVDRDNRVVSLALIDDLIGAREKPNWVVLMAGGLGTRLRPLTENLPKPMLTVRGKPILETILESLIGEGFRKFYVSVNYKAQVITDHFKDGSAWGAQITYLREETRLGTAGALSLIPEAPPDPLVVMNGDLLTQANISSLLEFHHAHGSMATMAVREYDFQVPYGVIRTNGERILSVEEKPVQRFFVNAGIYALSPQVLEQIPKGTYFDMPTLFDRLNAVGAVTVAFPLREYWLDIGRLEDFDRANLIEE